MLNAEARLEGLIEVSRLLVSELEVGRLLRAITESAARVAGAETASLLLIDPITHELYFDVALGLPPELTNLRLPQGKGVAGWVAANSKSLVIPDARGDPRWDSRMDKLSGFVTRSILAVPMRTQDRVTGVIEVINKSAGDFSPDDVRLLEAFAAQAAVALENARLVEGLRAEKRKFETVLSEMVDGAVLTDAAGRALLSNPAACSLLEVSVEGFRLEEALAKFRVEPPLKRILEGAEGVVPFEALRPSPKPLALSGTARAFPGTGPLGGSALWLWVLRDVTSERREETLKREFLSLLSHKLRTPLVSMVGYASILEKAPGLDESQRRQARAIVGQGQRFSALVERLLSFTRLQGVEALGLRPERISLKRLVDRTLHQAESQLEGWGLSVEAGEGLEREVEADLQILVDALQRLLENAAKFNPGAVKRAWIRGGKEGRMLTLEVEDNGPGIQPEDRERVVRGFYQVEEGFTGQVEGWGLGLAFVSRVAKAHGGSLRIGTGRVGGAVVTLELPAQPG